MPWVYANGIAKQIFKVEKVDWLEREQLRKVVAALVSKANISHSDGFALAVVSPEQSIGLDIECIVSEKTVQDTSRLILTLTERNRFQGLLTPELFTLIFSVKESFYKAAFPYVQRFFDFSAIDVIDIQSEQQQVTYRINQRLNDDLTRDMTGQAYFSRPFPEHIMTFLALKTV